MNGPAQPDWTLLRSFRAVAETGSLSAAARRLGLSQPTLGRHVQALEKALGLELFRRTRAGLEPTEDALRILPEAEAMARAAARLSLAAAGRAESLAGTVRITASVIVAHFLLPPILARIRRRLPEVALELVPSDTTENLLLREADIALRMFRPRQPDVITRHVAEIPLGLYAARSYLDRAGRPQTREELLRLDFVGYDRNETIITEMRRLGLEVDRGFFPLRCDDQAAHWQLVRAGCGVGGMQTVIGDADPLTERLMPDLPLGRIPLWLAAPSALRNSARIRRVWDMLTEELRALI
ncbi:MAG TPA: LysR family transcriptional regulator [Aliiroseovarius sp.]|nr:LysR family transcriptional regulator [Aliiroseovarius sp.]